MAREFVAQFKSVGADGLQKDFANIGKSTGTLDKGLKNVNDTSVRTKRRMSELSATVGDVGRALAGLAIAKTLGDAVMSAAEFETSMEGISRVLGEVETSDIGSWIEENGDRLNITKTAAAEAAKGLAVYGKQLQDTGIDVSEFTTDLIEVAGQLGAFNSADPTEVLTSMQSALRGEFDPLERFGVALTAAKVEAEAVASGLVGVGEEMSSQDKIIATYNLLMEDSAFAMGSVEAASDTLPGQLADLRQKFSDMGTTLGQSVLPYATTLADVVVTLVDGFNKLPGPVKVAIASFGGFLALKKTLGGTLSTLGQSLTNFRTELGKTQGVAGKFKAGLGTVASAFSPWTLAVTGGLTLLSLWIGKQQEAKAAAEEWAAGIDTATGALNEQGQALLVDKLKDYVDEAKLAGITTEDLAAVVGDTAAYDALIDKLREVADAHATNVAVGGRGGVSSRTKVYDEEGRAANDLIHDLQGLRGEYQDGLDLAEAAKEVSDGITGSLDAQGDAAGILEGRWKDLKDAVKAANKEYLDLIESFTALRTEAIDSRSAIYDYEGALDDLAETLAKDNTFSPDTEAGRANWDNLVSVAEAANTRITNTLEREGVQAAQTVYRNSRDAMHQLLTDAGVGSEQAWNLVNSIMKKPIEMQIELKEIKVADLEKQRKALRRDRAKILKEFNFTAPVDATPREAQDQSDELQKLIKPINVKINAVTGDIKDTKDDLKELEKPGGQDRKARIDAKVDPASLSTANTQLNNAAKDRFSTIYVTTVTSGVTSGGGRGGGGLGPTTQGLFPAPTATGPGLMAAGRQLAAQTFSGYPSAAVAAASRTTAGGTAGPARELHPRQVPVQVFIDGEEVAQHMQRRAERFAVTGSQRRRA